MLPHTTGTGKDAGTARPTTSGTAAATRATPTAARSSRASAAPTTRPNYGATPTPAVPVPDRLRRDGHERPGLPLRRRRDRQLARAGPSTGTAAGSCNDYGNTSAKHALLLDPATDQDGGQPVYADSLRGIADLEAQLHGLEVRARRRALRAGLRRASSRTGPDAGLYRFDYTGGADTPGPDPQWQPTATARAGPVLDRRLRRRRPTSGTSATAQTSRPSANPTHTYAEAGTYTAKLTVTYADGEKATPRRSSVTVGDDAPRRRRPSRSTARRRPPRTPAGQGHAERDRRRRRHRRRLDRVPHRRRRLDPRRQHGQRRPVRDQVHGQRRRHHTVEFRSRDQAGNVEDPPGSVTFAIDLPGGGGCLPAAVGSSSTARRSTRSGPSPARPAAAPSVADGSADDADAAGRLHRQRRARVQHGPAGPRRAASGPRRPRSTRPRIDANGEQAGLVIWKSENPNTFSVRSSRSSSTQRQLPVRAHRHPEAASVEPADLVDAITPAPSGHAAGHRAGARPLRTATNIDRRVLDRQRRRHWIDDRQRRPHVGAVSPVALRVGPVAVPRRLGRRHRHVRLRSASMSGVRPADAGDDVRRRAAAPLSDQFNGTTLDPKWAARQPGRRQRRRRWPTAI